MPAPKSSDLNSQAFVTLVTSDNYAVGALVLAHSLRESATSRSIVCLYTRNISSASMENLSMVFDLLLPVEPIRSRDYENLALLGRPELDISFTKFNVWQLTQFSKVVFLDADTLVLTNVDELFEREELSAAPDVGWPDCFNSGVFVCVPNEDTYNLLVEFSSHGSFDGGDQGILNDFFSDWASTPSRRLPFTFNVTPSTVYSYSPAYRRFKNDIKIVHFIGTSKPWTFSGFSSNGSSKPNGTISEDMMNLVEKWWQVHNKYSSSWKPMVPDFSKHCNPQGDSGSYYNFGKPFNPGFGGWSYSGPSPMADFHNYRIEWPEEAYPKTLSLKMNVLDEYEDEHERNERSVKLRLSPVTPTFSPGLPMNFDSPNSDLHNTAQVTFEQKMSRRPSLPNKPSSPPGQSNWHYTTSPPQPSSAAPAKPTLSNSFSIKTGTTMVPEKTNSANVEKNVITPKRNPTKEKDIPTPQHSNELPKETIDFKVHVTPKVAGGVPPKPNVFRK